MADRALAVRIIRVSTRATGRREVVRVYVYDELADMRAAAARFSANGDDFGNALGVCQTYRVERVGLDGEFEVIRQPLIVRLWRHRLGARIVTHEMSHAAAEIYGRTLEAAELASEHLHNANEVLAHLHSDLTAQLIDCLYAHDYYA